MEPQTKEYIDLIAPQRKAVLSALREYIKTPTDANRTALADTFYWYDVIDEQMIGKGIQNPPEHKIDESIKKSIMTLLHPELSTAIEDGGGERKEVSPKKIHQKTKQAPKVSSQQKIISIYILTYVEIARSNKAIENGIGEGHEQVGSKYITQY